MSFLKNLLKTKESNNEVSTEKTCSICGKKNKIENKFCSSCGSIFKIIVERYDAFISYRRETSSDLASLLQFKLASDFNKQVFLDIKELQVGRFDEELLRRIEETTNFILILSKGSLDRCIDKSDWLKREIIHALVTKRNIIPVLTDGFTFPSDETWALLPREMRVLPSFNGVSYMHIHQNEAIRTIASYMKITIPITPPTPPPIASSIPAPAPTPTSSSTPMQTSKSTPPPIASSIPAPAPTSTSSSIPKQTSKSTPPIVTSISTPTSKPKNAPNFQLRGIAAIKTNGEVLNVPVNCLIYKSSNCIYNGFPEKPAEANSKVLYPFHKIRSIEVEPEGKTTVVTLIDDKVGTVEIPANNSIIAQTEVECFQLDFKNISRIDFDHQGILQFDIALATVVPSSGDSFVAPFSSIMLRETLLGMGVYSRWHSRLPLANGSIIDFSMIKKIEIHELLLTESNGWIQEIKVIITFVDGEIYPSIIRGGRFSFLGLNRFGTFVLNLENEIKSMEFKQKSGIVERRPSEHNIHESLTQNKLMNFPLQGTATISVNQELINVPINSLIYKSKDNIYNGIPEKPFIADSSVRFPFCRIKSIESGLEGNNAAINLIDDRKVIVDFHNDTEIIAQAEDEPVRLEFKNIERIDFDHQASLQFDISLAAVIPSLGDPFVAPVSSIILRELLSSYGVSYARWYTGIPLTNGSMIGFALIKKIDILEGIHTGINGLDMEINVRITLNDGDIVTGVMKGRAFALLGLNRYGTFLLSMETGIKKIEFFSKDVIKERGIQDIDSKIRSEIEDEKTFLPIIDIPEKDLFTNYKDGTKLVRIPEGEFLAGGTGTDQGGCLKSIWLPEFYLALHPVTNAQYLKFLSERNPGQDELNKWINPRRVIRKSDNQYEFIGVEADHPVTEVSWLGIEEYCKWAGLRLPTELEWEKGARGTDGREYPWGNRWISKRCRNYETKRFETTCSIWAYPEGRSPWGLYQMSGNVMEWCSDWYDPNAYDRYMNGDFSTPKESGRRVCRGSSWAYGGACDNFKCGSRSYSGDSKSNSYGFRCAKTP
jgi:formylglycine-generating enzyme required for sulfatase activity